MKFTTVYSFILFLLVFGIALITCKPGQAQSWTTTGDTVSSTGTVKAADLNIYGTCVKFTGLVTDTNTDFLGISKLGKVSPLTGPPLNSLLYPPIPFSLPCDTSHPLWYHQLGGSLVTTSCTWVGVGEAGMFTFINSPFPDAPLSVSNSSSVVQFSVVNPTSKADIFTIDKNGNTIIGGNTSIGGIAGVGTAPSTVTTLNVAGIHGQYTTLLSEADTSNEYNIMSEFSTTTSTKIGLAIHIAAGSYNYDVFDADAQGNGYFAGRVVIGDSISIPGNYGLYVRKGILTSLVKVALPSGGSWSDYVFGNNYKLKPIAEVAQYIKENNHLPEVPSAENVQKNGIDVAEMDALMMKKIEELTLYIIQQDKKIQQLQDKVNALSSSTKK